MEVIKENSQVIAGLKTTMENLGTSTVRSFERIHVRLDGISGNLEKVLLITKKTGDDIK